MTDRPIIFSAPMVRALLDGRKSQTRRVLKPQPISQGMMEFGEAWQWSLPSNPEESFSGVTADQIRKFGAHSGMTKYEIGDRLWVRENFQVAQVNRHCDSQGWADHICIDYPAAHGMSFDDFRQWKTRRRPAEDTLERQNTKDGSPKVTPSIHMPRWASRLTLIVTDVRVQRLHDISEDDAIAEGVHAVPVADIPRPAAWSAKSDFAAIWNSLHGPDAWAANPWVVAVSFKTIRANIDNKEAIAA